MPSDRFLNLKQEKKKVILQAAVKEFSSVPYEQVSINQIIKNAGISRGSFYTYFEDKKDLLQYLMEDTKERVFRGIVDTLRENGGDMFVAARVIFDRLMDKMGNCDHDIHYQMIRNMKIPPNPEVFGYPEFIYECKEYEQNCELLYAELDHKKYNFKSYRDLMCVMEMLCIILLKGAVQLAMGVASREKLKKVFEAQLGVMQTGICRPDLVQ